MEQIRTDPNTKTILIVDDEQIVTRVVRATLVNQGYTVLEATTAAEAYGVAEGYGGLIHLLITNHLLKESRGREIAERIKAARPDMKVMHISGYQREMLEQEDAITPGGAFLQKPFRVQELLDAVRKVLTEKPVR